MNKTLAAFASLLLASSWANALLVGSFDDIQRWTGAGSNSSALVLQWNDGGTPASLAWGYRWDGNVSGMAMLKAIAGTTVVREPFDGDVIETLTGADPALQLTIERYGFGDAVYSMVYTSGAETRTRADWDSGYWEYSLFAGNIEYFTWNGTASEGPFTYNVTGSTLYASVNWWSSQVGASDRVLVNGSWDAWSFAASSVSKPVAQPAAAAVPEPRVAGLLALSATVVIAVHRKRRAS